MQTRAFILLMSVLATTLLVHPALADSPSVLYRLDGQHAFQEGCFGLCLCPIMLGQLEGTFVLQPAGADGAFETWTVSDVNWRIPELGAQLTGSGLFRLSSGPDAQQQLTLHLSLDGGPVETYDSGLVPSQFPLPRLDVLVSLHDLQCFDRVLHVQASPGAGPVAFRFQAAVTSVFDGLGALGNIVKVGDVLWGAYIFDPATPNTADPVDEGEAGLYHHDRPPAGVRIRAGRIIFSSVRFYPDFDIIVNNDFGFAGADEYGFVSRNNSARHLLSSAPVGRLDISWLASTFSANPLQSTALPLIPPDLDLLGGGLLVIEGECVLCLAPAAYFRIEATLTSLTRPLRVSVDRDLLWWEGAPGSTGFDVTYGSIDSLRASGGDFAAATEGCLANDLAGTTLSHGAALAPGEVTWFLARPLLAEGAGTYDSYGLVQDSQRELGIATSGVSCP